LSVVFSDLLAPVLKTAHPDLPVVPVPARRGGTDHMERICGALSRRHGFGICTGLSRKRAKAQKGLSFEKRLANIKGQISFSGRIGLSKVVLLDDIFTTGATADECARVLLAAGASRVDVLTLAMD
jgi:ComF family protein